MAASIFCRRVRQLGLNSLSSTRFNELIAQNAVIHAETVVDNRSYSSLSWNLRFGSRFIDAKQISQLVQSNGKRVFLVDTLALVNLYLT